MLRHQSEIEARVRLAFGFLAIGSVAPKANEPEIRNALSRSYYAMYHVCNAWLAMRGVPKKARRGHSDLYNEIGRRLGLPFRKRLKDFSHWRARADYDPGWFTEAEFSGHMDRFRFFAVLAVDQMRSEFRRYLKDIESILPGQKEIVDPHDNR